MGSQMSVDAHRELMTDHTRKIERERERAEELLEARHCEAQGQLRQSLEAKLAREMAQKAAKMEREKAEAVELARKQQEEFLAEIRANAELERLEMEKMMEKQLAEQREQLEKEREEAIQRQRRIYSCPHYLRAINDAKPNAIKIAFLGSTNQGKSTLVNELRGLRKTKAPDGSQLVPDDWAQVGSGQTTMHVTPYSYICPEFPGHELLFFDCPGAGTPEFPSETYIADMGLKYFHGVVVLSAGVMTQITVQMLEDLKAHSVPFIFARTKIDESIVNEECDNDMSPDETMSRAIQEVSCLGVEESDIFLVSSRPSAWRQGYGQLEPLKSGIEKMVNFALMPINDSASAASSNGSSLASKMMSLLHEAEASMNTAPDAMQDTSAMDISNLLPEARPADGPDDPDEFEVVQDVIHDREDGQDMAHFYE